MQIWKNSNQRFLQCGFLVSVITMPHTRTARLGGAQIRKFEQRWHKDLSEGGCCDTRPAMRIPTMRLQPCLCPLDQMIRLNPVMNCSLRHLFPGSRSREW